MEEYIPPNEQKQMKLKKNHFKRNFKLSTIIFEWLCVDFGGVTNEHQIIASKTAEPWKTNRTYFPLHWLFNRDSYIGEN